MVSTDKKCKKCGCVHIGNCPICECGETFDQHWEGPCSDPLCYCEEYVEKRPDRHKKGGGE